jgi:hypothetical protein
MRGAGGGIGGWEEDGVVGGEMTLILEMVGGVLGGSTLD